MNFIKWKQAGPPKLSKVDFRSKIPYSIKKHLCLCPLVGVISQKPHFYVVKVLKSYKNKHFLTINYPVYILKFWIENWYHVTKLYHSFVKVIKMNSKIFNFQWSWIISNDFFCEKFLVFILFAYFFIIWNFEKWYCAIVGKSSLK